MAVTLLNDIKVTSNTVLTKDVLGDFASETVLAALKASSVTLTNCQTVTQNAQLLIVTGKLADFPGRSGANVSVRFYLFEVPTIQTSTERHALLLVSDLPADYHVADLWNAYATGGPSAVTKVLSGSAFADQMLLLSSLDYDNPSYLHPPFPPAQDKLPTQQQTFVASLASKQSYVTRGFNYRVKTSLVGSTPLPDTQFTLADALSELSATSICQPQTFLSQTKIESASTNLVLFYTFDQVTPINRVDFNFAFESIGLAFPLGETATVLPLVQLRGWITIGNKLNIEAAYNLATKYLTFTVTGFPSFGEFIKQFTSHFDMGKELGGFLPNGDFNGLGSITLESIEVGIDFTAPRVERVRFVAAAEKSLSLISDLVEVQPSLDVRIYSPFDSKARFFEVDVFGRWFIEKAEIDTALAVHSAGYQVTASLALAQTLSLSHLLGDLLRGQIQGIPNLAVTGFDFIGIKSGTTTYYEVELDLDAGWHLGDLPLTLEDVHLEVAFTDGKLTEADLSATLELGTVEFTLSAEYIPDNEGWTFSGGTQPGSTIHVGQFIAELAEDLGVDPHNDFLKPFESIEITGLYLEYRTHKGESSQMSLFLSLHTGAKFGGLPLDEILVRFQTNGSGTMWRFSAKVAESPKPTDVTALLSHISSTHSVKVDLPQSLIDLKIEELSAYYDSSLGNYGFLAYVKFGDNARVYVQIDLKKQLDGKFEKDITGELVFNENTKDELSFELDLVSTSKATDFVAVYQGTEATPLSLASLVKAITGNDGGIPAGLSIDIRDAVFSHHRSGDVRKSIFAIDMDAGINLSSLGDLPVIGEELSAAETLKLAFQIIYSTDSYTVDELKTLNAALPERSTFKFPETAEIPAKTPEVTAEIRLGSGKSFTVNLPVALNKETGKLQPASARSLSLNAVPTTTDGIQWFDVKKNFGPLNLSRIGFKLGKADGIELTGYLDGGLSMMGLTVELLGLTVTTTLTGTNKFKPTFGLNGLGIDFKNGPLEIGGALYKLTDNDHTEFDGMAMIRTKNLQLSAIGSFAELSSGDKSLLIYAVLNYPLGGPAFFYVTGLAAGFGYNRHLLIPPVDQLKEFPLIAEAMASEPAPPITDMSKVKDFISGKISGMQSYIPPKVGEYFVAVGVHFTSFKLLDSFALLTVQFGEHFEVDVLGISTMVAPPNVKETPIAQAQLLLKAAVIPDEGTVLVQGQLTNDSYIFSRDCHLTGGFAFASWLKGEHEGDFVVSLGGYHPDFKVPAHYPQVPRVGFNWSVSSELTVKGGGYYALMPHAIMAGANLEAVFQTSNVKAWFSMNADFLLMWKPFHYDAQLSIHIGAEITIELFGTHHIGIEAGADLHLWGPDFGGHASVSVKVIGIMFHFSIDFGASASSPAAIGWADFQTTFLPANDQIVSLTVEKGLERTVKDEHGHDVLVINRKELSIATNSVVPIKLLSGSFSHNSDAQFGVAPMNEASVKSSEHKVTFTGHAGELNMEPLIRSIPSALWGQKMETELNRPKSMLSAMTGVRLTPAKPSDPGPIETVDRSKLAYDTTALDQGYQLSELHPFKVTNANATWKDIETNLLNTNVVVTRSAVLTGMGFDPGEFNCNQTFAGDAIYPPQYGEFEVKNG